MERETSILTILFADVADSTRIYETLGDKLALDLVRSCIDLLKEETKHHQGSIIKTIGDEIMSTFPTANNAIEAARAMNTSLDRVPLPDAPGVIRPAIRIGVHMGPVIKDRGDIFGDAVNVTARLVSLAEPKQILTTEQTVEGLLMEYRLKSRHTDKPTIKGKSGNMRIFEILWGEGDLAVIDDTSLDPIDSLSSNSRLSLKFQGKTVHVNNTRPTIALGRQNKNDLPVKGNRVSRIHARIEYRDNKFALIDQSSNGTYILFRGEKKCVFINEGETILLKDGLIGLGNEVHPGSPEAINFTIKFKGPPGDG